MPINPTHRACGALAQAFVNEEREGSSVALTNELVRLRAELAAMRASMQLGRSQEVQSQEANSISTRSSVQSR